MTNETDIKEESFTLVTSRHHRRKGKRTNSNFNNQLSAKNISVHIAEEVVHEDSVIKRINTTGDELKLSAYFQNAAKKIRVAASANDHLTKKIICFGIGHFSHCSISRHQLAFILAIKSQFNIPTTFFHEPILTQSEISILRKLNCIIVDENFEGKVSIDSTDLTLIYSPHCPKQLTNNFLWQNWSIEKLQNLIFIGNSFANLLRSTPSRFLASDAAYIVKLQPHCNEIVLENTFKFTDIFNDTALHTFPVDKLNELPPQFWSEHISEPIYSQNIELITFDLVDKLKI